MHKCTVNMVFTVYHINHIPHASGGGGGGDSIRSQIVVLVNYVGYAGELQNLVSLPKIQQQIRFLIPNENVYPKSRDMIIFGHGSCKKWSNFI